MGFPLAESTRRVVGTAHREAALRAMDRVDTGHLLLSLIKEPDCCAVQILNAMNVDIPRLRTEAEGMIPHGSHPGRRIELTSQAWDTFFRAYKLAQSFDDRYVRTEHLLVELARDKDGTAGKALARCGVELDDLQSLLEMQYDLPSC